MNPNCPSPDQLTSLSQGKLSQEQSDKLLAHVQACDSCLSEMVALDQHGDSLIQHLQTAPEDELKKLEQEKGYRLAATRALAALSFADSETGNMPGGTLPKQIGEYDIVRPLGRGGMGQVFLGRHTKLGRTVAIKFIADHRRWDEAMQNRFAAEMKVIGSLDHPNIVAAHDAREVNGVAVLVTEFIDGMTISEILKRKTKLNVNQASRIAAEVCQALSYIKSKGLVHRDIKPSNIMIAKNGRVKLLDLGLARGQSSDEAALTSTHQPMGTADYVAPEQINDSRNVDFRADLYSLGCTLYKLLTGHAPFSGEAHATAFAKMSAHVSEVPVPIQNQIGFLPTDLADLIDQLLRKNPAERPQSVKEVFDRVKPFCKGAKLAGLVQESLELPELPTAMEVARTDTPSIQSELVEATIIEGVDPQAGAPASPSSLPEFPSPLPNSPLPLPGSTQPLPGSNQPFPSSPVPMGASPFDQAAPLHPSSGQFPSQVPPNGPASTATSPVPVGGGSSRSLKPLWITLAAVFSLIFLGLGTWIAMSLFSVGDSNVAGGNETSSRQVASTGVNSNAGSSESLTQPTQNPDEDSVPSNRGAENHSSSETNSESGSDNDRIANQVPPNDPEWNTGDASAQPNESSSSNESSVKETESKPVEAPSKENKTNETANPNRLVYQFGPGQKYKYSFSVDTKINKEERRSFGSVTYEVATEDPRKMDRWEMGNLLDNASPDQNLMMLSYSGHVSGYESSTSSSYLAGDLICDDTGQIIGSRVDEIPMLETDDSMIPFLFEAAEELALIELPADDSKSWSCESDLRLNLLSAKHRSRSPFSYRVYRPYGREPEVKIEVDSIILKRKIDYTIESENDREVVFKRVLDGNPRSKDGIFIEMDREDRIVFSKKENVVSGITSTGTTRVTRNNVTVSFPFKYELELKEVLSAAEVEAEEKSRKERAARVAALRNAPAGMTASLNKDLLIEAADATEQFRHLEIEPGDGSIASFDFSANGRYMFCSMMQQKIVVVDTKKNKQVEMIEDLQSLGSSSVTVLSDDGKYLVVGGSAGKIEVWKVASTGSLKPVGQFGNHTDGIVSLAIDPTGTYVISGAQNKVAKLWKLKTQEEVLSVNDFSYYVIGAGFRDGGKTAMACCRENFVSIDVENESVKKFTQTFRQNSAQDADFSHDGSLLAVSEGSSIEIYESDTLKKRGTLKSKGVNWTVKFMPDGKHLISGHSGMSIWDVESFKHVHEFAGSGRSYVQVLGVSDDGSCFAGMGTFHSDLVEILTNPTSDSEKVAEIKEQAANKVPRVASRIKLSGYSCNALKFSSDGKRIYVGDQGLSVYDVESKKEIQKFERLDDGSVKVLAATPDDKHVLVGTNSGKVLVFQKQSSGRLKEVGKFVSHSSEIKSLAVSPDNKTVVSGDRNRARIWNLKSTREALSLEFEREVKIARVLANGKAAVISDAKKIAIVTLANMKVWKEFDEIFPYSLGKAAISIDGEQMAVVESSSLSFVETKTGTKKGSVKVGYSNGVLAYHPNGKHLLRSANGEIEIWDVGKQEKIESIRLEGKYSTVNHMEISPDGKLVAAKLGSGQEITLFNFPIQ